MISPNNRMAVTDSRMATTGFSRRSRNSGRASMHAALHSSSVHSSQWGLATSGMRRLAADCCRLVPLTRKTCQASRQPNVCSSSVCVSAGVCGTQCTQTGHPQLPEHHITEKYHMYQLPNGEEGLVACVS